MEENEINKDEFEVYGNSESIDSEMEKSGSEKKSFLDFLKEKISKNKSLFLATLFFIGFGIYLYFFE